MSKKHKIRLNREKSQTKIQKEKIKNLDQISENLSQDMINLEPKDNEKESKIRI